MRPAAPARDRPLPPAKPPARARASRAAIVPLALAAVLGCRGPDEVTPWRRVDLTARAPDEIRHAPHLARGSNGRSRLVPLGPADLYRHLGPAGRRGAQEPFAADRIAAVLETPGATLVYRLTPGERGFLSFVPLPVESGDDDALFRVAVRRADGRRSVLYERSFPRGAVAAAAEQSVDLARFAGAPIALELEVGAAAAASPAKRRPPEGWGALAAAWREPLAMGREQGESPRWDRRPSFLLIGLDTTRADALGAWGRRPSVTPTLDALAAESSIWTNAYSCFNVTNPSFVSTMTGLYGAQHGVYALDTPVDDAALTLAEIFRQGGYATYAAIAAGHLANASGLEQGFDLFERPPARLAAQAIVDRALAWLDERPAERPFFAWLHFFDPHTPNSPSEPYASGLRHARPAGLDPVIDWLPFRAPGRRPWRAAQVLGEPDLYLGEVAYLDRQLGRLLDALRARGELEHTYVVVWADHGENLGEHGIMSRHTGLFETTTHVPLLLRAPGAAAPAVHRELVQNVDLFPTLVAAAGLPVPASAGQDLLRRRGRRAVFAEASENGALRVRTEGWALMRNTALTAAIPGRLYLFDLRADPGETANLAGRGLAAERELSDLLDRWLKAMPAARGPRRAPIEPGAAGAEELRALGYL
jgi:arylsulfatase A-like enzyme